MAIVVVDDDDDVRNAVRTILEEEGHRTVGASSGEEALELLRSDDRPTLILLDLMMPGMDGWQFLERIDEEAQLHAIPVALMSAHPSVKRAFDRARPCDDSRQLLLPKPLNVLRLLSLVEHFCGRPDLVS